MRYIVFIFFMMFTDYAKSDILLDCFDGANSYTFYDAIDMARDVETSYHCLNALKKLHWKDDDFARRQSIKNTVTATIYAKRQIEEEKRIEKERMLEEKRIEKERMLEEKRIEKERMLEEKILEEEEEKKRIANEIEQSKLNDKKTKFNNWIMENNKEYSFSQLEKYIDFKNLDMDKFEENYNIALKKICIEKQEFLEQERKYEIKKNVSTVIGITTGIVVGCIVYSKVHETFESDINKEKEKVKNGGSKQQNIDGIEFSAGILSGGAAIFGGTIAGGLSGAITFDILHF